MLDNKNILIIFALVALFIAYVKYKEKIGQELVVAFLFALFWTSYYNYEYIGDNVFLFGEINFFPLVLWTAGLVFLREIYERITKWRFFSITILYWLVLISLEFVGYYTLDIQLASQYPSLLNLGVIHIPLGAQIFYITAGPTYLLVTDYLKVK